MAGFLVVAVGAGAAAGCNGGSPTRSNAPNSGSNAGSGADSGSNPQASNAPDGSPDPNGNGNGDGNSTPGSCTVSALLVPSCGAWLGSSTPSNDGKFDYSVGLAEYAAVAQNPPDILHFYKRNAEVFPNSSEIALSERSGRQRALLLYNWKPSTTLTWRQIANGRADDAIASVAANIKAYPRRFFLALYHEPENDLGGPNSGMTPTDYVDMYRHVVGRLDELGVTNAVYVMNYMGFNQWADVVDPLYPGDDVVDWIAYDPYGREDHTDLESLLNRPDETGWPGFYDWATNKAPGKPIMLAEWGINLLDQPDAPAVLDGGAQVIEEQFPMIKALVYWNSRGPGMEPRIDQDGDLGTEFGQSYANFANSPYFNLTTPDDAP